MDLTSLDLLKNWAKVASYCTLLADEHDCHTVILFGSRARGDAGEFSDFDFLGVRSTGTGEEISHFDGEHYLDVIIKTDEEMSDQKVRESILDRIADGIVLKERDAHGRDLIRDSREFASRPVSPPSAQTKHSITTWVIKTLERVQEDTIEAEYRHVALLKDLRILYFRLRGIRHEGTRKDFLWLRINDPKTYEIYRSALQRPHTDCALAQLCERVLDC